MKKILVLGGTRFIGRFLVEKLIELGAYEITLFHRGKTNVDLFPEAKRILGDRETNDISKIGVTDWDYVIDLSCYYPKVLADTLASLKGKIDNYVFISTCSVYDVEADKSPLKGRNAPMIGCTEAEGLDRTGSTYGKRKVACEEVLEKSQIPHTIIRPTMVYGPYDYTDRLYYWLYQVYQEKAFLLPEGGERKVALVYIGDLVDAIIASLDPPVPNGIYNSISQAEASIGEIVSIAERLLGKKSNGIVASIDFLKENKVEEWSDLPLWINGEYFTFDNPDYRKDFQKEATSLEAGIAASIQYAESLGWPEPGYGIKEKKKQELLHKLPQIDYVSINKQSWNARTTVHVDSDFYDNKSFIEGRSSLNEIELAFLKDIAGKEVLHLQCHFGQDTISLGRLGAKATGVDLSDVAIKEAKALAKKTGIDTSFVCSDIYDLPNHLQVQFDVVFSSYGTIGWLPDLDKWAEVIAYYLKPGGSFIFAEFHPFVWMFDDDFKEITYRYFNFGPLEETEEGTYAETEAAISEQCVTWNHSLGEVMSSLLKAGIQIKGFQEYDYSPYNCFNNAEEVAPGKFRIKWFGDKIPMVYSIVGVKD